MALPVALPLDRLDAAAVAGAPIARRGDARLLLPEPLRHWPELASRALAEPAAAADESERNGPHDCEHTRASGIGEHVH